MGVNITTIDYLRVLIIEIGSTIILKVVEAQGRGILASLRKREVFGKVGKVTLGHLQRQEIKWLRLGHHQVNDVA